VGVSITNTGTRETGLETGEPDAGQHDWPRDVLAVSSAGMLVRRDVWDDLGGFDPALPVFNDWDFLIRMIGAGVEYAVVPELTVEWREHDGNRISTPSLRRAAGIETFIAKHGHAMPEVNRRDLTAVALGIRWRNAGSLVGRLRMAAKLLRLLGLREAVGRRLKTTRRRAIEVGS